MDNWRACFGADRRVKPEGRWAQDQPWELPIGDTPLPAANAIRTADLGCSAGGFTRALQLTGAEVVFAVDHNPAVKPLYDANCGHGATMTIGDYHSADMWEKLAAARPGLVVISTPCQELSTARDRHDGVPREGALSSLTPTCIERLVQLQTPIILLENVPQVVASASGTAAFALARAAGYHVAVHYARADRYGPPYKRRRALVVMARDGDGIRDDLAAAALAFATAEIAPSRLLHTRAAAGAGARRAIGSRRAPRSSTQVWAANRSFPSAQSRMFSCSRPPHPPLAATRPRPGAGRRLRAAEHRRQDASCRHAPPAGAAQDYQDRPGASTGGRSGPPVRSGALAVPA